MAVVAAGLLGYVVGWLDHRADLPDGWSVISGEARVIDGDTLEIDGVRIRLHGLDAPERYQRCLTAAGVEYRCGVRAGTALDCFVSHACSLRSPLRRGASKLAARSRAGGDYRQEARRREAPTGIEYKLARRRKAPTGIATITCLSHDTDRWGRRIARCFTEEADINRWLVQNGHALAYRRYSREYDIDETYALEHRRGLWSGRFVPPQAWRQGERLRN